MHRLRLPRIPGGLAWLMTQCEVCQGQAQLFLCKRCTVDLRTMLIGLGAGFPLGNGRRSHAWLAALQDAANGDTRLGEPARRSPVSIPNTDSKPLPYSETASGLLEKVRGMLGTWIRHLCETRGVEVPG
jgi:hypothetical protein